MSQDAKTHRAFSKSDSQSPKSGAFLFGLPQNAFRTPPERRPICFAARESESDLAGIGAKQDFDAFCLDVRALAFGHLTGFPLDN